MSIISSIGTSIEGATSLYVNQTSAAIIGLITPIVAIAVTIWIINYGLAVTRGQAQAPVMDFTWKAIKISMILGLGLSVGTYQNEIVPLINETFAGLSAIVSTSTSSDCSFPLSNIYALLDCEFMKPLNVMINIVRTAMQASLAQLAAAVCIALFVGVPVFLGMIIFFLVASLEVFYSRLALQLLLGIGPFFICALAFEPTKKYFDGWLGKIVYLAIFSMLVFAWLGIATTTLESLIKQEFGFLVDTASGVVSMASSPSGGAALETGFSAVSLIANGLEMLFAYLLFAWLGLQLSGIASALSGIGSSGSAGAFIAGGLTRGFSGAAGTFGSNLANRFFKPKTPSGGGSVQNAGSTPDKTSQSEALGKRLQQTSAKGREMVRRRNG